jgi:Contact-dependent growth inhibition CdiA C-terminal domain
MKSKIFVAITSLMLTIMTTNVFAADCIDPEFDKVLDRILSSSATHGLKKDEVFDAVKSGVKSDRGVLAWKSRTKPTRPQGSLPQDLQFRRSPDPNYPNPITGENNAADYLANEGFDLRYLPEGPSNTHGVKPGNYPDFLINGKAFDAYTPEPGTPVRNIHSNVGDKTTKQAERVIVNLEFWDGTDADLSLQFSGWEIATLKELIILRNGKMDQWFPF